MKPEDLLEQIKKATLTCTDMILVLPHGFKRPKGFPRGEKLSENEHGRVYSFEPHRMLQFMKDNNLV